MANLIKKQNELLKSLDYKDFIDTIIYNPEKWIKDDKTFLKRYDYLDEKYKMIKKYETELKIHKDNPDYYNAIFVLYKKVNKILKDTLDETVRKDFFDKLFEYHNLYGNTLIQYNNNFYLLKNNICKPLPDKINSILKALDLDKIRVYYYKVIKENNDWIKIDALDYKVRNTFQMNDYSVLV